MTGVYIAVEGIDGAGTSTHTDLLASTLRKTGYRVVRVQEPSGWMVGRLIRGLMARGFYDQEVYALLFAADRLHQYRSVVKPALERGDIVVSCRSLVSSLAYQSLDGAELLRWLMTINSHVRLPDIVVYLDVPVEAALARIAGRGRRDVFEKPSLLRELQRRYRHVLGLLEDIGVTVISVKEEARGRLRGVREVHREAAVKVLAAIKYLEARSRTSRQASTL